QYTKDYNNIEIYSDDRVFDNTETEKVFIFGGGTIYNQYLNRCDEMFITEVDTVVEADTKFPDFSEEDWELIDHQEFTKDENNEHNYVFMHYKRRKGD
ncbi:dihydrofolate reductase, partial [Gemella sanguinis]